MNRTYGKDDFGEFPIDDGRFIPERDAIDGRTPPEPQTVEQRKEVFEKRVFDILVHDEQKVLEFSQNNPNIANFKIVKKFYTYSFSFHGIDFMIERNSEISFYTINGLKVPINALEEFLHQYVLHTYLKKEFLPVSKIQIPKQLIQKYLSNDEILLLLPFEREQYFEIEFNKRLKSWEVKVPSRFTKHFRALIVHSNWNAVSFGPLLGVIKNNLA